MPEINYQLLKLYIDSIPEFSGNENNILEVFIDHCDSLIRIYENRTNVNDPINSFLIRAIISKLKGTALMLIGSRPEIRQWVDLKSLLRLSFGDQRSLDCLVQDLIIMRPNKSESYLNFGQRIQKARSAIASKLISSNTPLEERRFQIKNYDDLALKTFIRGLSGRIQDMIRLRNPDSLEEAISLVLEEENFALYQRQCNSLPEPRPGPSTSFTPRNFVPPTSFTPRNFVMPPFQRQIPRPNFTPPNFQPANTFRNTYNHFPYTNNSSAQTTPKFQWPSQPINIQPQPAKPQKFFTNQQVFGPPRNVFKPTGQVPQHKPEPMSTTSRQSFSQFKPKPPQFHFEELHNIEGENNYQSYDQEYNYEHYTDGSENYSFSDGTDYNEPSTSPPEQVDEPQPNLESNFCITAHQQQTT